MIGFAIGFPDGAMDAGATNDCLKVDGVTISVAAHPEATIVYSTAETVPKPDATLTATTTSGVAAVTFADELTVEPTATKPGCTLTGKHDGFTGRAVLRKGTFVQYRFIMTK